MQLRHVIHSIFSKCIRFTRVGFTRVAWTAAHVALQSAPAADSVGCAARAERLQNFQEHMLQEQNINNSGGSRAGRERRAADIGLCDGHDESWGRRLHQYKHPAIAWCPIGEMPVP
jgi:hypothetical protein